jgi:hypothetical protein
MDLRAEAKIADLPLGTLLLQRREARVEAEKIRRLGPLQSQVDVLYRKITDQAIAVFEMTGSKRFTYKQQPGDPLEMVAWEAVVERLLKDKFDAFKGFKIYDGNGDGGLFVVVTLE